MRKLTTLLRSMREDVGVTTVLLSGMGVFLILPYPLSIGVSLAEMWSFVAKTSVLVGVVGVELGFAALTTAFGPAIVYWAMCSRNLPSGGQSRPKVKLEMIAYVVLASMMLIAVGLALVRINCYAPLVFLLVVVFNFLCMVAPDKRRAFEAGLAFTMALLIAIGFVYPGSWVIASREVARSFNVARQCNALLVKDSECQGMIARGISLGESTEGLCRLQDTDIEWGAGDTWRVRIRSSGRLLSLSSQSVVDCW